MSDYFVSQIIIYVVYWMVVGGVGGLLIAAAMHKPRLSGLVVGALLGVFGWFLIVVSKGNVKKCPNCAETVQKGARVCRYCRYEFAETETEPEHWWSKNPPAIVVVLVAVVLLGFLALAARDETRRLSPATTPGPCPQYAASLGGRGFIGEWRVVAYSADRSRWTLSNDRGRTIYCNYINGEKVTGP